MNESKQECVNCGAKAAGHNGSPCGSGAGPQHDWCDPNEDEVSWGVWIENETGESGWRDFADGTKTRTKSHCENVAINVNESRAPGLTWKAVAKPYDEPRTRPKRRCHACDEIRDGVGDGFNTMPLCASCLKAWHMGDRHGREARNLEDPPKWPPMPAWVTEDTCEEKPLPEDKAIDAAFPTRSGRHDLYAEAMRLVGARRSKAGLVSLVNWLLHQRKESK